MNPVGPLSTVFRTRAARFLLAFLLMMALPSPSWGISYTFTPLPAPFTNANGINNAGAIVGQGPGSTYGSGYLYQNGTVTPISVPGTQFTETGGINNSGTIVGSSYIGGQPWNGFVYSNGTYTQINSTQPGAVSTLLYGINDSGAMVGFETNTSSLSGTHTGFLDVGGTFTTIQPPGTTGAPNNMLANGANGINNAGTIVGAYNDINNVAHGYIYSGGTYMYLNAPGATGTVAFGINNGGAIVGYAVIGGKTKGLLLSGSTYTTGFLYPGSSSTGFNGINDYGQVVGTATVSGSGVGFVGTPTGVISWGNSSSGTWNVPSNWNPAFIPDFKTETVQLTQAANPTVTYTSASGTTTVGSITATDPFVVTGGTLILSSPSIFKNTANALTLSGGILEGTGAITVTGPMTWTGGTLAGTGATNLNGGATIDTTGGNLTLNRSLTIGNNSTTNFQGGNSLLVNNTLTIASGSTFNAATLTGTGSIGESSSSGSIVNNGTFLPGYGSGFGFVINNVPFTNKGIITQSQNNMQLVLNDKFINTGTITLNSVVVGLLGGTGNFLMEGGNLSVTSLEIQGSGTSTFTQSGTSQVQVINGLDLGAQAYGPGTYTLNAGKLTAGFEEVGSSYSTGKFYQTGGSHTVSLYMDIGEVGGSGIYTLSNGGTVSAGTMNVGEGGTGTFTQNGTSTVQISGNLTVGDQAGSNGTYNLKGGTLNTGVEIVGNNGTGTFVQTLGNNTTGSLTLTGTYTLSGGNLSSGNDESIQGTFTQSGGSNGTGELDVGNSGTGTYTLRSGSLTVNGPENIGLLSGYGSFDQSGGAHSVQGTLEVGLIEGAAGFFNLSGGTLTTGDEIVGDAAQGHFYQSGGTNTTGSLTVDNGGSSSFGEYVLSGNGKLSAVNEDIGGNRGLFTQTGGTNIIQYILDITDDGGVNASAATYTMGSGILSAGSEIIADLGSGNLDTFSQSGGSNTTGTLTIGIGVAGGSYTLAKGGIFSTNTMNVGEVSTGSFSQSGSSKVQIAGALTLGDQAGSNGTYNLSGGTISSNIEIIGNFGNGNFIQSSGANTTGELTLGNNNGGTGTYSLSGGVLSDVTGSATETIGYGIIGSTDTFIQSGGTNKIGFLNVGESGGTGSYTLRGTGTLFANTEILGNTGGAIGNFVQAGGTNNVGTLILGESIADSGTYSLSGGTLSAGNEAISVTSESVGDFNQTGGLNKVSGTLYISYYNNNLTGTYSISGGTLKAGTIDNGGFFNITGPTSGSPFRTTILAAVNNNGNGVISTSNSFVTWEGNFANDGVYASNKSTQNFTSLTIGSSGYLQGGSTDVFSMAGSFQNTSLQNTLWNTALSTLDFTGNTGTIHDVTVAGINGVGYTNNFSWGNLILNAGNGLSLSDGSGNALYVTYFDLKGGLSQLSLLTATGVTIYYNPSDPSNAYLGDKVYALAGGGSLDPLDPPYSGTVATPEPSAYLLFGTGLVGLLALSQQRKRAEV